MELSLEAHYRTKGVYLLCTKGFDCVSVCAFLIEGVLPPPPHSENGSFQKIKSKKKKNGDYLRIGRREKET
jgi:hypothetical protein